MKSVVLLLVLSAVLAGCGSSDSMSKTEIQNFAPPKGKTRSPEAGQQIADFKKRFEEKHGGATNAPPNIQTPASNAPTSNVGG